VTEEPVPAEPAIPLAVPVADPAPRSAAKAHGTKILDLSSTDDPLAALAEHESMEPTAMLGREMAAAVNAAARPPAPEPEPAPAPEPPRPKRKYGSPPEAAERRTLMVDAAELSQGDEAGPPADAGRTLPPARRAPARSGGAGRVVLLILALALVGAGGGAAIWWFGLRKPAPEAKADDTPPPAEKEPTWDEKLSKVLEDGQATLPTVAAEVPLAEQPFVAGGPEALGTSAGVVPGLPSVKINEPLVESDGGGEWVRTLKAALDPIAGGQSSLALALDASVPARTLTRMAYSGFKAGFRKFGLVVNKQGTPGARAVLPFTLHLPETTLPKEGAVVVRIGRLGLIVVVQGPDGAQLSAERTTIPRKDADNSLDLKALGERLDALHTAHPDVKAAVVYPNDDLTLDTLAQVMNQVRRGASKDRFPDLAVSTR
jgi:hypothetical protein